VASSSIPTLALDPGRRDVARRLRRGHPWVWADSLREPPGGLEAGAVVDVVDGEGRFVGRGLFDPGSPIAVRIFSRDPGEAVDAALVRRRVAEAAARREAAIDLALTDCYRLVHGEADELPGVVVDRYADVAVARFDGAAAATLRAAVAEAALALPGIGRLIERDDRRATSPNGAAPRGSLVVRARENGLAFEVDVVQGQKTGLFLDQRDNRALVRAHAAGRRLLNLFAYTGGFTVAAAAGGCRSSLSVDLAAPAIAAARRNLALNGFDGPRHELRAADAFDVLRDERERGRRWDLIVVDPPSFAPRRSALEAALASYRRLNAAVLRLAEPGALVLSCSCSSHVGRRAFLEVLDAAAREARVPVARREVRGAGPDHPVARGFPEGDYLKAVLLEVRARPRGRAAPAGGGARGGRRP
jgi:23S rRNA (cytosine1962-C5)-methyltransferase